MHLHCIGTILIYCSVNSDACDFVVSWYCTINIHLYFNYKKNISYIILKHPIFGENIKYIIAATRSSTFALGMCSLNFNIINNIMSSTHQYLYYHATTPCTVFTQLSISNWAFWLIRALIAYELI